MYKTLLVLDSIKFQETVFALPFAFTGMILAADGLPTLSQLIWITVAMVTARSLGMSSNRIIDRHIDARNPRTSNRHLPKGILGVFDMKVMAVVSCIIFVISAAMLNTLALILAPFAACFLVIYPYTKRFTWASNLLLGGVLAIAPSAAWIGVTGELSWEPHADCILRTTLVVLGLGRFRLAAMPYRSCSTRTRSWLAMDRARVASPAIAGLRLTTILPRSQQGGSADSFPGYCPEKRTDSFWIWL